jgi:hypothetical protein
MLRRTFFALVSVAAALRKRLPGQSRAELNRLAEQQLSKTPFKSAEIMGLSSEGLIGILEDPASSEFAKAKACQRLAAVGDESAVPAVAALLSAPRLSHYARTALEPMPGPAADRALRDALGSLDDNLLVGVINSIGWRRDAEALPALAALRHGHDANVAAAATSAISRIRRP